MMKPGTKTAVYVGARDSAVYFHFITMLLAAFLVLACNTRGLCADSEEEIDRRLSFEKHISSIADGYIGTAFRMGADPDKDQAADNSHLLWAIYGNATRQAGLPFKGYMAMNGILANTHEVDAGKLKNGDLVVLHNGLAAMIFGYENMDAFHIIYASEKRRRVAAVSTREPAYKYYWQKNLKGFFRLNDNMFE